MIKEATLHDYMSVGKGKLGFSWLINTTVTT